MVIGITILVASLVVPKHQFDNRHKPFVNVPESKDREKAFTRSN